MRYYIGMYMYRIEIKKQTRIRQQEKSWLEIIFQDY